MTMNNELEMIWKEESVAQLRCYSSIWLEVLRKTAKEAAE
jgi:hypothetical protein